MPRKYLTLPALLLLSCTASHRRLSEWHSPESNPWDEMEAAAEGRGSRPAQWDTITTENFRVFYLDPALALRVSRRAEALRTEMMRFWSGRNPKAAWRPRCDLYLYPSFREMIFMTGGDPKAGSAVVQPSKLYKGRILSRRLNLTANDRGLLSATMPHEITHLVLSDLLDGEVPLWANEGAATYAEGARRHRHYARMLRRFRRPFLAQHLFEMQRYPDRKGLFYAQASSFVRMLLNGGPAPEFVRFVRLAKQHGYPWALSQVYQIDSLQLFERLWRSFLKQRQPPPKSKTRRPG